MSRLVTVSLFSGCGGSDLGAARAGAEIVYAIDKNHDAITTYKAFVAATGTEVTCSSVAKVKAFPPCELLIGCYPCQSFTMGGPRAPEEDPDSRLFLQFRRCLQSSQPKYFVAENVSGLAWLQNGRFLKEQLWAFSKAGEGYSVSWKVLDAKDYGVPESRKRIFLVGVRRDIGLYYWFPPASHGPQGSGRLPYVSHGDAIASLPPDPRGEYYDREDEPFSWWYMSRNRKRRWEEPSSAIQANWRHVPLHPASPTMRMVESNLKDGFKQRWEFTGRYDHLDGHPGRPKLERPRRLSWRECAAIQTFPPSFEPHGPVISKYRQVGNAVPPLLMEKIVRGIVDSTCLRRERPHSIKASSPVVSVARAYAF